MPDLKADGLPCRLSGLSKPIQIGSTLLESLVAMLVLVIGVLALASVQLRTLAETQTAVRRGQAIRAIEDLSERIKANPDGFGQLRNGSYASDWNSDIAATVDRCSSHACNPAELARSDIERWKSNLAETLPLGSASVFMSPDEGADAANSRQLGVMVGWRSNERTHAGDADDVRPFQVSAGGIECPRELLCHLAYVQP